MEKSKRYNKRRRNLSIDRLSDLPDSILCHILSFLPTTKDSVATSILARRWRYLWSYVPNLVFDYDDEDSINRVLLLYKVQSINTFRLTSGVNWSYNLVRKLVTFAVERNAQNIDISLESHSDLHQCLFTCKTLVDLRLEWCGVIPVNSTVFLPRLKKLHLLYVPHDGYDSLQHLLSGCPVLEELLIHLNAHYDSCKISSPTIKRLMIELINEGDDNDSENKDVYHRLEINTPALVYLQLVDLSSQYIKCGALNSLIEADINIDFDIDDFPYARSVVEFIDRLRNVKCLKLQLLPHTKIIDSTFSKRIISFHNLAKLDLTIDCSFLLKFLENADNLEILILREVYRHGAMECWMEPQQVPTCLSSRLRTIKLVGIKGEKHELEIISYLLRNSKVLERMEIVYFRSLGPYEKIYMLQEISAFQRGSSLCEVRFV